MRASSRRSDKMPRRKPGLFAFSVIDGRWPPRSVRLLQPARIGHAADGSDRPASTVAGEAVVGIGIDGARYAGAVERNIVVGEVDRSSGLLDANQVEGDRGGVDVDTAARDHNASDGIA